MRILFLTFCFSLFVSLNAYSQAIDSPINPLKDRNDSEIGVFVGLGGNILNGTMYVDCVTCEFSSGSEFGYSLGLLYQTRLHNWFQLGVAASYDILDLQSSYTEVTMQQYEAEAIKVPYKHTAILNMSGLSLFPYVNFDGLNFMFLRIGPGITYILDKNLDHTMRLETNRIITNDGRVIDIDLIGSETNEVVFEDNEMTDYSDLLFFVNFNLGFNIPLNLTNTITPSFQFNLPINNTSSYKNTFNTFQWRIILEYRYYLSKNFQK